MSDTDRTARRGMMTYVAILMVAACITAIFYFTVFHPGTPIIPAPG